MFSYLARLVVVRSQYVLLALSVLAVAAGLVAPRIRFDFTPQSLHDSRDGAVRFAEQHKATFGYEDAVVVVAVEATGQHDVLAPDILEWQWEVSNQLRTLSHIASVESVALLQIPYVSLADGLALRFAPLIRQIPIDDDEEVFVRRRVSRLRLLEGTLLSRDKRVSAIVVMVDPLARDIDSMQRIVHNVSQLLDRVPPPQGYAIHMTGLPALRVDIVDTLQRDLLFLFPLAGFVFLCALTIVFRRVSVAAVSVIAVVNGLAWTIALMVMAGQSVTILSNVLPVLTLIIGVSNCVHVIARFAEEAELTPGNPARAMRRTVQQMSLACLLTLGTTAIGFGSLMAAKSHVLGLFGGQAAVSMLCQYVSIMLILGAVLWHLRPPRHSPLAWERRRSVVTTSVVRLGAAVGRHPRLVLACGAVIAAGALAMSRNVVVDSHLLEAYDDRHPTSQELKFVEENLSGVLPIEVNLAADDRSAFLRPDVYRRIAEFQAVASVHPDITLARSYVDLFQEVYANWRRRPELRDQLPTDDEDGRRRIRRSAASARRLAELVHYRTFMTDDGCHARILLRARDGGTRALRALIADLERELALRFPPSSDVAFHLTGDGVLHALSMHSFVRDLFYSLLAAALIIFGIVACLFRSLRVGLIAAVPNLTPLILTLGYLGLRGYDLNVGNAVVFAISLGIAVDNTIHFLARFREEMRIERNVSQALQRTFRGTGRAIVLTVALIVSGFAVLLLSDFLPTRRFAELSIVTMAGALFGDLVLLPACLALFWKEDTQGDETLDDEVGAYTTTTMTADPDDQPFRPSAAPHVA